MKKETLYTLLDLGIILGSVAVATHNTVRALQSYKNHNIELMIAQGTVTLLCLLCLSLFFKIRTQQSSLNHTKLQRELDRDLSNFYQEVADTHKKSLFLETQKCKEANGMIEHLQEKLRVYKLNRKAPVVRKKPVTNKQ